MPEGNHILRRQAAPQRVGLHTSGGSHDQWLNETRIDLKGSVACKYLIQPSPAAPIPATRHADRLARKDLDVPVATAAEGSGYRHIDQTGL